MNIRSQKITHMKSIRAHIEDYFKNLDLDAPSNFVLSRPKDPSHGHLATNAPFLARIQGEKPRETAEKLATHCALHPEVISAEPAGAGFVNITLTPHYWQQAIYDALKGGELFGKNNIGNGQKILIEYISANPTGPLHAGHARIAVLGDTIASLLSAVGYDVIREYYVNDAGGQIRALGQSLRLRYLEALKKQVVTDEDFGTDGYRGEHVKELGQKLAEEHGESWLNAPIEQFDTKAVDHFCTMFQTDLAKLDIHMDNYISEKKDIVQSDWIDTAFKKLKESNHIYQGVLEKPKGHDTDNWEPRPQWLFRSTDHGDDQDRALQKSDESWTYFAGDVGYHAHKMHRTNSDGKLINIFGADHSGYVKRIQAVVQALGHPSPLNVLVCQMVNFLDNGEPVRMSKRTGQMVTMADVVDRVGAGATRFLMLWRHHNMTIDFDFAKAVEQTHDNPIFYIQYAHARICSVLRHAQTLGIDPNQPCLSFDSLTDNAEIAIMQRINEWPDCLKGAALAFEPHRVPQYLYELASDFHSLWGKGKSQHHLRFIDENNRISTLERLYLLKATAIVLRAGLKCLNIKAEEIL